MTEANSPYFARGQEDGRRDTEIVSSCPGGLAVGLDPEREWSVMYRRGYDAAFAPAPHVCNESCKAKKEIS